MDNYFKIAILDMNAGEPNEGMRCLEMLSGQFLSQNGVKGHYDLFEVRINHQLPTLEDFDIFLMSGGPGSPLISNEAWEAPFFSLLDGILFHNLSNEKKKFAFLVCHSFQLACLHWDIAKVTKRRTTSFGIFPIYKTKSGENEPLFDGLDNPFYAVDSRDYQVIGPSEWKLDTLDGKVLCREKIRENVSLERAVMAIRFSKEIFGVQFHPEADSPGMRRYLMREDKRKIIVKKFGLNKYKEMVEQLDDDNKIMKTNHTIIPRFFQQAAAELSNQNIPV